MKSFKNFSLDPNKDASNGTVNKNYDGMLMAQYELYRKVSCREGYVVKCGVVAGEGIARFAMLAKLMKVTTIQNLIAFEKKSQVVTEQPVPEEKFSFYHSNETDASQECFLQNNHQDGLTDAINFIPGAISDAIPNYLIENPEMKITYLNIDLDEYEATFTTLQYFYPRVVHGGIIVFDNYYKKEEEYNAVNDYFQLVEHTIYNFSVNKGPHYVVRA